MQSRLAIREFYSYIGQCLLQCDLVAYSAAPTVDEKMISPAETSTGDPHRPLVLTACHATFRTTEGIAMHKSLDIARIKYLKSVRMLRSGRYFP